MQSLFTQSGAKAHSGQLKVNIPLSGRVFKNFIPLLSDYVMYHTTDQLQNFYLLSLDACFGSRAWKKIQTKTCWQKWAQNVH